MANGSHRQKEENWLAAQQKRAFRNKGFEREGETNDLAVVFFFVSTVDPLKEPPLIAFNPCFFKFNYY